MEAATIVAVPTSKQKKVLDLIAKGKSVTQIAKAMGVTPNAIYGHIRKLKFNGLLDENGNLPGPDPEEIITLPTNEGPVNGTVPESMTKLKDILRQATEVAEKRIDTIGKRLDEIEDTRNQLEQEANGLKAEAEWLDAAKPSV